MRRPKPSNLAGNVELRAIVEAKLGLCWSAEQIVVHRSPPRSDADPTPEQKSERQRHDADEVAMDDSPEGVHHTADGHEGRDRGKRQPPQVTPTTHASHGTSCPDSERRRTERQRRTTRREIGDLAHSRRPIARPMG